MKQRSKYLKTVDRHCEVMGTHLELIMDQVREELLIPYCNRTGLRFTASMGSFSFDKKGHSYIDYMEEFPARMPQALKDFLFEICPLNDRNDFGSLMQDYTPPGWVGD